ncbi:MAG: large conductance mechanosensitive channel protein MscL [Acidimicrobiales bacterium]
MLKDFKAFLLRGNVVDLAVAVVIGAAFSAVIAAISTGLITPLIGLIIRRDFNDMKFTLGESEFDYGTVIDAAIRFVSYAAVIFFLIVKPMQVIQARRNAGDPTADTPAPSDEALLLTEIRDLLAQRA